MVSSDPVESDGLAGRYRKLALLGQGGMGEVWRVHDAWLDRTLAMKVQHATASSERFLREARITARLSHPGIVPVMDMGQQDDGRWFYTMPEVRGRTLEQLCLAHFQAEADIAPSWRLIDAVHRACEAMAYAHSQALIHRDLKPSNVMVGAFGEVMVLDWGLAREAGAPLLPEERGAVSGTPAWMAPEQARGEDGATGPQSDVYSLGATLFTVLRGRSPWGTRSGAEILLALRRGELPELPEHSRAPPELLALCLQAMAPDPAARPAHAGALAAELLRGPEGARRREQAARLLTAAERGVTLAREARQEALLLRGQARARLADVPPHAPEEAKIGGWALEDEAARRELQAELEDLARERTLGAALEQAPDLDEAREAMAEHARARLLDLEARGLWREALRYEGWLAADPWQRHADFLRGDGEITLLTEPAGATVSLRRYEVRERRSVPVEVGALGQTPLHGARLGRGSWLLTLEAPGHAPARYPVRIGRGARWEGIPPGEDRPQKIPLLPHDALEDNDRYVPAGWFQAGGDPDAPDGLSAREVWVDGFIVQRDPVTNAEYLAFLNDLLARGRPEEAARHAPSSPDSAQRPYRLGPAGYALDMDGSGQRWRADAPVVLVDWEGARAFAAWRAAREGHPWRLLHDLEWEKAARGVDGRPFPWGEHFDPARAAMVSSHAGAPHPGPVDAFPRDESPYGVRGMAGNVRDWCQNGYLRDGDTAHGQRVREDRSMTADYRLVRGGSVFSMAALCRAAARMATAPGDRLLGLGFRLGRTLPEAGESPTDPRGGRR